MWPEPPAGDEEGAGVEHEGAEVLTTAATAGEGGDVDMAVAAAAEVGLQGATQEEEEEEDFDAEEWI